MLVDGDAAAIVGDGQPAVFIEVDVDPVGVTGNGLVHRVVDNFGKEVMQGFFIGAANIHGRAPAHRLKALEYLNVGGVVIAVGGAALAVSLCTRCFFYFPVVPIGHSTPLAALDGLSLKLFFQLGKKVARCRHVRVESCE